MLSGYENKALMAAPENKGWGREGCIVAAPGPSLTSDVIHRVRMARWIGKWNVLAVQDAYRVMPWADAMYGCNPSWWRLHKHCEGFRGEKWSSHEGDQNGLNYKIDASRDYDVRLVHGRDGRGFSTEPGVIHYGGNSGFQSINLALQFGARRIVLVGFDMRCPDGRSHYFGDHPAPLHQNKDADYRNYLPRFEYAAAQLPDGVTIVNATPGSALRCFPMMDLECALAPDVARLNGSLHRHGAESHASTD
jgi:hypothetical protein